MYNLMRADLNYAYRKHMLDKAKAQQYKANAPETREPRKKVRQAYV